MFYLLADSSSSGNGSGGGSGSSGNGSGGSSSSGSIYRYVSISIINEFIQILFVLIDHGVQLTFNNFFASWTNERTLECFAIPLDI